MRDWPEKSMIFIQSMVPESCEPLNIWRIQPVLKSSACNPHWVKSGDPDAQISSFHLVGFFMSDQPGSWILQPPCTAALGWRGSASKCWSSAKWSNKFNYSIWWALMSRKLQPPPNTQGCPRLPGNMVAKMSKSLESLHLSSSWWGVVMRAVRRRLTVCSRIRESSFFVQGSGKCLMG